MISWNTWVPQKVNVFMWQDELERIQTRVTLAHRNIQVKSTNCAICDEAEETTNHLFYEGEMAYPKFFLYHELV